MGLLKASIREFVFLESNSKQPTEAFLRANTFSVCPLDGAIYQFTKMVL